MNRLKELRNQRKLTLDDIEAKTGIKRGTYSNYENGMTEPKLEVWQKLADFFNVSVPYLQGFETQVPNRLRKLRESKGLTLKDTVKKMKNQESLIVTADALAKYERGDREPKLEMWQELARFFNVSVPYLQGFDEHKSNRLKELRNKKGISQSQFVQAFNELLISKKMKPITIPTYSRWENSLNSPTEKVWQQLADYFEVSVPYLKGEIDTEYLEKLVETLMLINLPGLVLKYRNNELDNLYKPIITIAFTSRIINLLGYDSREKFEEIYTKAIKLGDSHLNSNELKEYKRYLIKILTTSKEITNHLLKEYEKLEEKQK